MFHPTLLHLTHTPDNPHAYYVAWFLSLHLISNSSTSFKLHLELSKIDFVLSSANVYLVYCLQTNQGYCWSLWLTFFVSVTSAGRASMNHLHIITIRFPQLGSYYWHKSKTIEDLKLSLTEHHIQYLWILKPKLQLLQQSDSLLNRIHANWSYSLKILLEEVYQVEFCDLSNQMLFAGKLNHASIQSVVKTFQNFVIEEW